MKAIQLSLFEDDMRSVSDEELISELTNGKGIVSDVMEYTYGMEKLFNSLTPQRRKIAVAAVELYRRREMRQKDTAAVHCSQDIFKVMHPLVADLANEEFWIVMLNRAAKLIKKVRISVGGIDQTCVDVRLVMRILIENGAVQFAAVHNHPSGNTRPSEADKRLTDALKNAAALFNIHMIDHIVVAGNAYYSFSDEGVL